jgi:hypothetical protein
VLVCSLDWFTRRPYSRWVQTVEVRISGAMKASANSGGRLDESETTLHLSRTRQGDSTISKERLYWLTRQLQHERRERSLL